MGGTYILGEGLQPNVPMNKAVNDVTLFEIWLINEEQDEKWPQAPHEWDTPEQLVEFLNERNRNRDRSEGGYYVALGADGMEFIPLP